MPHNEIKLSRYIELLKSSFLFEKHDIVKDSQKSLVMLGIKFVLVEREDFQEVLRFNSKYSTAPDGILIKSLSQNEKRELDSIGISYITLSSDISIHTERERIICKPASGLVKKVRTEIKSSEEIPPTALVSPYALGILDCLFRLNNEELRTFNTYRLSREFGLSQSRFSKMMSYLNVKTPYDLKNEIQSFDLTKLVKKFRYARTRQKMTPYFELQQSFHSLEGNLEEIWPKIEEEIEEYPSKINYAPPELLKNLGMLRNKHRSIWVDSSEIKQFKRRYKLTPASNESNKELLQMCSPANGFTKEAVLTKIPDSTTKSYYYPFRQLNIFRTIWDLGYGDSRHQELQRNLLWRVMNES